MRKNVTKAFLALQSRAKLVETNGISERISPFLCMETPTRSQRCFSSPSPPSMFFGRTEDSSGGFWWQSNIDKGERGKICCGN